MGLAYIKTAGSKASGESTADDWSDANCYAPADIGAALNAIEGSDPATLTFDDGLIEADNLSLNNFVAAFTLLINSRSGSTIITLADGTTRMFTNNSASNNLNIEFQDINFSGDGVTWTDASSQPLLFSQSSQNVSFTRCTWSDWTRVHAGTANGLLVRHAGNTGSYTLNFTDCIMNNFLATVAGDTNGVFEQEQNINIVVDGFTFDNISIETTGAGTNNGIFYVNNTLEILLEGIRANGCLFTAPTGEENRAFLGQVSSGAKPAIVRDAILSNITMHGEANTQAMFRFSGTSRIEDVICTNIWRTGRESGSGGNSLGGAFLSTTTLGAVTARNVHTLGGGGFYGMGGYSTGGATASIENGSVIDATDNGQFGASGGNINGIGYYGGGDGDFTLTGVRVKNITQENTPGGESGMAIYVHHVDRQSRTAKTSTLRNVTVEGSIPVDANTAAIQCNIDYTGATHTIVFDNVLVDLEEYALENREINGTLNLTAQSLHITGGTSAIDSTDVTTGTVTLNSPTSGDPLIDDDGVPGLSSLHAGGVRGWVSTDARPSGSDGEPFPDFNISIGAIQSTDAPMHTK